MTISSIINLNIKIYCFIFYKFQNKIIYESIFIYLKENFNFKQNIIRTDYKRPSYLTFKNKKNFMKKK